MYSGNEFPVASAVAAAALANAAVFAVFAVFDAVCMLLRHAAFERLGGVRSPFPFRRLQLLIDMPIPPFFRPPIFFVVCTSMGGGNVVLQEVLRVRSELSELQRAHEDLVMSVAKVQFAVHATRGGRARDFVSSMLDLVPRYLSPVFTLACVRTRCRNMRFSSMGLPAMAM